jgi:hypothetical protein
VSSLVASLSCTAAVLKRICTPRSTFSSSVLRLNHTWMSHLHIWLERTVGLPRIERRAQRGCKTVWPVGTAEAKAPGVAQAANSHSLRDYMYRRLVQIGKERKAVYKRDCKHRSTPSTEQSQVCHITHIADSGQPASSCE